MKKKTPAKKNSAAKKAQANRTVPAKKAGPAGRAIAAKKTPSRRSTTERVKDVIKARTGVRPVLLRSTLESLAIVSRAQLSGLAGKLGDEFNVPASSFNLSASTTVDAIVDMA